MIVDSHFVNRRDFGNYIYDHVSSCNGTYFVFEKSSRAKMFCQKTKAIAFEEFILSENIHREDSD